MAAKYSDRFRQLPQGGDRDVVDLGELGRPHHLETGDDEILGPGLPDRHWHRSVAARLALIGALVVGAIGGAYGLDRWQTYEAEVAARSAVELVTSGMTLTYSSETEVAVALRYRNEGEHEIVLRDVRFDTERLVPLTQPKVLEIAAGDTDTHVVTVRSSCPDGDTTPVIESPSLVLTVETIDGVTRNRVIDSDLVGSEVANWLTYTCDMEAYLPTFGDLYAEVSSVTPSDDGTTVDAALSMGLAEDNELVVDAVEPGSPAFSVIFTLGETSSSTNFQAPPITVTYRVNDCVRARQASDQDMSLTIRGSLDGAAPGTLYVLPTARLAAELVRLAERSCAA